MKYPYKKSLEKAFFSVNKSVTSYGKKGRGLNNVTKCHLMEGRGLKFVKKNI
jgi:hypothetical protein